MHFRREKYLPRGGPDGGDGGKGGDIVLVGNSQMWTLLHLRYTRHLRAEHGEPGSKQRSSGAGGKDVIIELPLGTVAKDPETDEMLAEITEDGQRIVLIQGGRGGQGNDHFKTSTNQAPRYAQPGEPGMEGWFHLELKILADVGLVGLPNAGKSTLLSVLSNARPKVADYEFTTLEPNLGVLRVGDKHLVIADIPGLIEGASEGKGLGIKFLRHIERTRVLIHLVPANGGTAEEIYEKYKVIKKELKSFGAGLEDKKEVVVLSKIDLVDPEEITKTVKYFAKKKVRILPISSATGAGVQELIGSLTMAD